MSNIAFGYAPAIHPLDAPRPQRHLHAVADPIGSRPVRLTRRGRLTIVLAAIAMLLLLGVTFGGSTAATNQSGTPTATQTITVKAGQTLWQIAAVANPTGDIRDTVDDIMKLNSLPSAAGLQMGRDLAVPVYTK